MEKKKSNRNKRKCSYATTVDHNIALIIRGVIMLFYTFETKNIYYYMRTYRLLDFYSL